MTAQGEGILAWTVAAISRREEAARYAARPYGPRWVRPVDTDVVRVSEDGIWFQALSHEIAEHVVYNDPASVLRRCAADRKILAKHQPVTVEYDDDSPPTQACRTCGSHFEYPTAWPCTTLRALAEGYGWTEGER